MEAHAEDSQPGEAGCRVQITLNENGKLVEK